MASIKLSRPIEHDGRKIETIDVDEPTLGAMEVFEKAQKDGAGDIGATVAMLAHDCGIPADAVRKIRASDLLKINEVLAPFLNELTPKDAPTGDSSQPTSPTS